MKEKWKEYPKDKNYLVSNFGKVKSLKDLTERTLEKAAQERITISEKQINLIINQMNKKKKIQFTQTEGWKILI